MSLFKDRVRYLVAELKLKLKWGGKPPASAPGFLPKAQAKPAEAPAPMLAAKAYERK